MSNPTLGPGERQLGGAHRKGLALNLMNGRRLRALVTVVAAMACLFTAQLARAATIVACVGDSITAGAWPGKLGVLLGNSYTTNNYGVSGTTLLKKGDFPYWNTQQFTDSHAVCPNIVVIMLGTNDSKPQNWGTHSAEYVGDYEALIDSYATLLSKPRIFLNLPPPAGMNGFGISGTIIENEILPLVRQTAGKKGTGLIDIFSAFGGHNFDASLYGSTADEVHPNDKGAQKIADTVFAAVSIPRDAGTGATDAALRDAQRDSPAATGAGGGSGGNALGSGGAAGASASGGAAGGSGSGGAAATSASDGSAGSSTRVDAAASSATAEAGGAEGTSSAESAPEPDSGGCSCRLATVPGDGRAAWFLALMIAVGTRRRRS